MGNNPWSSIVLDADEWYDVHDSDPFDPLGSILTVIVTFVFIMPGWVWNVALEPVLKGVRLIQVDINEGRNQASLESENGS